MKKIFGILVIAVGLFQLNIYAQNQVLSLDGDGDVLNIGNDSIISPDNFTLSVWVKNNTLGYDGIFTNHFGGVDYPSHFFYINGQNKVEIRFYTSNSTTFHILISESIIPLNEWVHISATYDGSQLAIYINSIFNNSTPASGVPWNSTRDFYIGTGDTNIPSIADFDGQIDEVRIWDYARTQDQIQSTMNTNLIGNEGGLVGYWNFDDGTANDLTSNSNDGTLIGNAVIVPDDTLSFLTAKFTANPKLGYLPLEVNFTDESDSNPTNWQWYFGDGDSSSVQNPTHIYNNSGIYDVKLIVNNVIERDSLIKDNYIVVSSEPLPPPDNLSINVVNYDVVLEWSAVDTTIFGQPVTVDYYLVYKTSDPYKDYEYFDYTFGDTLSYIHNDVVVSEEKMFYVVVGFIGTIERLNEFIEENQRKNFNEVLK